MAVIIGIGAMMGPGIFALPGELAHMVGPLGIFAYLAMGILTVFKGKKARTSNSRGPCYFILDQVRVFLSFGTKL
jgi:hypothetical protein